MFLGLLRCVLLGYWEGSSLLAGNSPSGTGEKATGRVDVPGEKQCVADAAAAATAAASSPPGINVERENWQILVRTLTGRTVALQVLHSLTGCSLDCLISENVGLCNGKVWRE